MLGKIPQRGRGVGVTVVALPLEGKPPDQITRQAGHEVDVTGIGRVFGCAEDRFHVESRLTADLEGAGAHDVCGGCPLGAVASLDDERSQPHTIQEQAGHHADRPTADDEYRNVDSRHCFFLWIGQKGRVRSANDPSECGKMETHTYTKIGIIVNIDDFFIYCFTEPMADPQIEEKPSRGHKKRERTRHQLIAAGIAVLAEKGEALTISDVVARAEVSNGTFYNYFVDRDELIDALAEHSLIALAAASAIQTSDQDPARRFAFATLRVLSRAAEDPTWGRAVLRLIEHRRSSREMVGYLREDLASGFDEGRFEFGADAITLDVLSGLILMSVRRIVRGDAGPDHAERVLERALAILGIAKDEAETLATEAVAAQEQNTR
jgi:AcrR family transcriptional regulator